MLVTTLGVRLGYASVSSKGSIGKIGGVQVDF